MTFDDNPSKFGADDMSIRSLLFVPGNSERKLEKAFLSHADALILDLEDSVDPSSKALARQQVQDAITRHHQSQPDSRKKLFVRINDNQTQDYMFDLKAAIRPGLSGIVLPKVQTPEDIELLNKHLNGLESPGGVRHRATSIFALTCETASAVFKLNLFTDCHPRLEYLTWGAEDLRVDLGALNNRDEDGEWTPPFLHARTQCLYAARATKSLPIDTVFRDFKNVSKFKADCLKSKRDGFVGRLAIHPDQIDIINQTYAASETDIDLAKRIILAFQKKPNIGAIGIDGEMYDRPHLEAAKSLIKKLGLR